jgi:Ni2+-binding GTPase involved in maturation of urease and hydrogenase
MRMVTFAGPPSTGKTSVILRARELLGGDEKVVVVKFDCLASDDRATYERRGIETRVGISAGQCPDHFFASNACEAFEWARGAGADLLVTESAGLCNRCSPYIRGIPAVCVVDCLAGVGAPGKMGPLLRMADLVVMTKAGLVSQAEREVFAYRVQGLAPRAEVVAVNGITGQGARQVARVLEGAPQLDGLEGRELRFSTPSALCSYCLGERRLGREYQMGNVRRIDLS